jgi:alginate O-acetyltransferase complex protein AlgI
LCFGFSIPNNFNQPYAAIGFSDFWRRWHISLSTWLRDYLYIPLGGNRKGEARTYVNLMTTMLIGGLWHGASWTFVAWGGLHGVYLAAERGLKRMADRWSFLSRLQSKLFLALLTYVLVNVGWVLFRAKTFAGALAMLAAMVGLHGNAAAVLPTVKILETIVCITLLLFTQWYMRDNTLEHVVSQTSPRLIAAALAGMAFAVIVTQGTGDAFIYFQF